MGSLAKYVKLFNVAAWQALKNYKALIGLSIFLMTCMIIFAHIWNIAAARIGATAIDPAKLLWYIAFNEWILVSIPDIQDQMHQDLRSGRLSYLLPRPISYLGATFVEALGALCVNLVVLGVVTFTFTWIQVGALPFHPIGLVISAFFGLWSGIIAIIFLMLIGLSAFWLQEIDPFFWCWEKMLFMFGGLILPLTLYPQWLQSMAQFTPFPVILSARSSLAIDFDWHQVMLFAVSTTAWSVIGLSVLLFVYRKGLRILNIEGG